VPGSGTAAGRSIIKHISSLLVLALSSAALAPSAAAQSRKLSGELARGNLNTGSVRLSPDGSHVVFSGTYEQTYDPVIGLYSAVADGSADPVRLWGHQFPSGSVSSAHLFRVTPDSSRVVFAVGDAYNALFSAPLDGSTTVTMLAGSSEEFSNFLLTPDGSAAVYALNGHYEPEAGLYRVPTDGSSEAVRLFTPRGPTWDFVDFQLTADGSRVLFTLDEADPDCEACDVVNPIELYSVPVDGSASAIRLSRASRPRHRPAEGVLGAFVSSFVLTPDSTHALYTEREQSGACPECSFTTRLFSVPVDGSATPTRLFHGEVSAPAIGADSNRVVYLGGATGARLELLSQPIDGSESPRRLHRPLANGGHVERFELSADGEHAVFTADLSGHGHTRLFVAPIDGSAPARPLGSRLLPGRSVRDFHVSPDSRHVVYSADRRTEGVFELYAVTIDGVEALDRQGAPAPQPTALSDNGDVTDFAITADGAQVLFHASEDGDAQLFRVPIDASAPALRLSGAEGSSDLLLTNTGRAVYRGAREHDTQLHVYSAPIDGNAASAQVDDPSYGLVFGRVESFELHPDGRRALFASEGRDFRFPELALVSLDGDEPAVLLDGLVPESGLLYDHRIDPGSDRVVYRVRITHPEGYWNQELFSAPLDGTSAPVRLNGDLADSGRVLDLALAGARVVYQATVIDNERAEMFSVPVDGSASPLRLNDPLPDQARVFTFQLTPDASQVLYTENATLVNRRDLFVVPADGSAAPRRLNGPLVGTGTVERYAITPDGAHALYVAGPLGDTRGLYSVPIDGSAQPVLISAPLVGQRQITGLVPSPDSSRVAYFGDQDVLNLVAPFVAPVDGSASALPLAPGTNLRVNHLQVSPDGAYVVYVAVVGTRSNVYSVPIDASASPLQLNPLVPSGPVTYVPPPMVSDGWVVYLARDAGLDLFAVPVDGSAPAHRVNAALPSSRGVDARFAMANGRVVFLAPEPDGDYAHMLRVAPIDGSAPPIVVNPPGTFGGASYYEREFLLHPDGQRILFRAGELPFGQPELYLGFLGRPVFGWSEPDETVSR